MSGAAILLLLGSWFASWATGSVLPIATLFGLVIGITLIGARRRE